ncbi:hypothetical protein MCOR10_009113 [Pyricularia oryzae]|nr:hypothetical protein MCOR10_009113 [Pyricularia oryzae]KAI6533681.1 hypothetical protein MCOR16_003444 [Pyricularia oryzae]
MPEAGVACLLARVFQQGDRIKGGLRIITDDDPSGLSDYPFHCVVGLSACSSVWFFFVPFAQAAGATIIVRLVTSFVGKRIALLGDSVAVGCHDVHVPQLRFFILKAAAMRAYFRVGEMGLEGVGEVLVLLLGGLQLKAPGLCRLVRGRI